MQMTKPDSLRPVANDGESAALAACYRLLRSLARWKREGAESVLIDDAKNDTAEQNIETKNYAGNVLPDTTRLKSN